MGAGRRAWPRAYLVLAPPSADLAAQDYRADLGLVLWDNGWYGGHHMPGYSVLFPPLAALLGPRLVGALSAVGGRVALRAPRPRPRRRARRGAVVRRGDGHDAHHRAADLRAGRRRRRSAAVLAAARGRTGWACVLAALASLASPVAGAFVALAAAAWWLDRPRWWPVALAAVRRGARPRARHRLPRGRQLPVRRRRASGPRWPPRSPSASSCPRDARVRAHRRRALRRGDRGELRAGDADGRQRRAPRRALRRAGARRPRVAHQPPRASPCSRCRSCTGSGSRRSTTGRAPPTTRPCTSATTTGCSASSGAQPRRPLPPGDPVHRQPLGVALGGAARAAGARLGAPGRPRSATRSSMTNVRSRRRATAAGSTTTRCASSPWPTRRSTTRRRARPQLVREGTPVPARGLARRALARLRGRRRPRRWPAARRARPRSSPSACA